MGRNRTMSDESSALEYTFDSMADRDRQIWLWANQGITAERIAKRVGLGVDRVKQIKCKIRGEVAVMSRAQIRGALADQLDWARERMAEIAAMPGAPVTKTISEGDNLGSRLVYVTEPGTDEVVRDHAGTIQAVRALAAVQQRLAALIGADEPARV